ncbi:hypothetical protein D3C86_709300 [compost metagenome]
MHQRAGRIAVIHQQHELLAAQPAEAVAHAHRVLHDLRVVAQRGVASRMAIAVVDGLEVIDVQHQHRQLASGAFAALELVLQFIQDAAARIRMGQAVEGQRGLHFLGLAGLDHEQQRQEQRRHRHRSAYDEEHAPGRGLEQGHGRGQPGPIDIHAQRVQRHQPEDRQYQVKHHARRLDALALPEDDPARCRHQHTGIGGKQHHASAQVVVAIQQQGKRKRTERAKDDRAQDVRAQAEELAHADVDQSDRTNPGGVRHHHVGTGGNYLCRGIRQHGQHGQRIRRRERGYAFHTAGVKRQQQRQRQRRRQTPHQEKQGSRHGLCRL